MAKKTKKSKHNLGHRKKRKKVSDPHGESFQQALAHHQAGRLPQAKAIYRQILSTEPNHPDALHYLGILALQVGKNEIAVELINKAISCRPDYIDAHINLGIAFKELDKLDEAVACYSRALALKPDNALAHYNLGNVLNDQGKQSEAVSCYRRALTLKPDYVEAYNNLGNVLKDQDNLNEAVACYRQALTLQPDDAVSHNNLGNTLKELGKQDEAVASFRRALSLKPDFAEAHRSLGVIFIELGRMDDAIACFRKALSLKPDYAAAYVNLSLIVKYTEVDDFIHAMEDLYTKKGIIPDTDRIDLGFALGKVFEDLMDYDKSFDFIFEANRLKRGSYEYSIQDDRNLFERIKKVFSPDFFASHHGSGNQDRTPIFILGMPRSGTTLVEQILASHPLVFGAGELAVLENLANDSCTGGATARFPECMLDLGVDAFARIGLDYIEKIREYSNDAQNITDKMPYNFLRVGFIKTILPNAKVIHCMRNPMDNCFSIFKTVFAGTHGCAYDMVELGQYYKLYQDLMAYWDKVLPGFMYGLRYEEVVADQQNQTKSLLDFCGLPWDEACLAFHKTERSVRTASLAQVRQPIYKDSVELWKRYEKQLGPLRKAIYR